MGIFVKKIYCYLICILSSSIIAVNHYNSDFFKWPQGNISSLLIMEYPQKVSCFYHILQKLYVKLTD